MILTDDQIKELVKHPANAKAIERGKLLYQQHIRHVKGIGVEEFFINQELKGFENEEEKLLRRKISRATTVPILASALGTFDKAFSASGYSSYSEIKGEGQDKAKSKEFKAYLNSDLGDGMNLRQWMEQGWGDKIHYDFNGVLMVNLPEIDVNKAVGKKNAPKIIFKSICDIHDYGLDGMRVEYLILKREVSEEKYKTQHEKNSTEYYRFIDDLRDVIVRVEKGSDAKGEQGYENIQILNTKQFPQLTNIWGYVPAIVISSQVDATTDAKQSFIWQAIGTCDDYLLDSSIANTSKKKHGFPQKWSYEVPCKICSNGNRSLGKIPFYESQENKIAGIVTSWSICKTCNGLGNIQTSPSIAVIKPMPDAQNPDIGEPFGYVTPDIESMRFQIDEMARLEQSIHESIWTVIDAKQTETVGQETATKSVLDVSAKQTKLNKFSSNGEKVEQFITNCIGKAIYKESWLGAIVNWGRKYYILTENELEKMLRDAKASGVNASILSSYIEELIYVRYSTDPVELSRQLKLFEIEPFPHMTTKEVQELTYCAVSDKWMKTYFNDYIETINRTNPTLLMTGDVTAIEAELKKLNEAKMKEANAQVATDMYNPTAATQQQQPNSK